MISFASVDLNSATLTAIESFNVAVKTIFELMLDAHKDITKKRTFLREKQQMIQWLIEINFFKKLFVFQVKRRFWVRANFEFDVEKLYRNRDKTHQQRRKMMIENELWNFVCTTHNSLEHVEQNSTFKEINMNYYEINRNEVIFLIKLCEICQRKHHSRFKDSLIFIVSIKMFERVQMNLIDMRSIFDRDMCWICHIKNHMSKFHQLYAMKNKKTVIVTRKIHHWISWIQFMNILQCDNDRKFKDICLQLLNKYDVKINKNNSFDMIEC